MITEDVQEDILKYLAEWKTGRYGRKLTWEILSKAFGFSRQALNGNLAIKAAYNDAKAALKDAVTEIDTLDEVLKELDVLRKQVVKLTKLNNEYEQRYLRWQFNAEKEGISVTALNAPISPSLKQMLREKSNLRDD